MVFEAVVADVLNRFLGDYVENLNRSQLKIGIWGGDVVLENLILKENALEELNIPVQTVYGHLGKLVLKIPWKNLYGASVEATVENLFLIVNPTAEVKYDAEKEEKQRLASKLAELQRVEDAKKQEAQKDEQKVDDSFVEKLATQIIKNVQLNIKDIHIRYEDSITNPAEPFSFGITLHNLSVHTTDDTWRQTIIHEAVTKIFKILNLEGLAVYLNPSTKLYAKMPKEEILARMQQEIATKSAKPNDYNYVLGPINSTSKLKLNPKPELDSPRFSIPKCILSLHMEQLTVCINKEQYQDVMKLADSMDRMSKGIPYRKYRPHLSTYKRHYKEWWKFAYTCVVEEDVRRRRKNWDWAHMLSHRNTCRDYAAAYQNKLTCKGKVPKDQTDLLDHCEKKLDIFNLVVIRQRIELEVDRLGKAQEEANKNKRWFSSWWGGASNKDDELSEETAIMKQFEKAMTPEEKAKLFRAIDYQENSAPTHLPAEFVALECHFSLDRLAVSVTDKLKQVLLAEVENVQLSIDQRPSANAIKVGVIMQEFTVLGVQQGALTPKIVGSQLSTQSSVGGINLLNVTFETNPLSNDCGQRLQLSAKPLRIVYDAETVIQIVNVFQTPPDSTALKELQAVAGSKLSNLKEKSALGMEHAVSQHAYIDLDIHFHSSYIVIPHGGLFTKEMSEACLVVNLGAISIKSEPRTSSALNVHAMHKEGLCDDEILKQVLDNAYDKFVLNLTDMQVLIATKGEDWLTTIMSSDISPQHLLQPTTLKIQIQKCLITDDPRLANIKVRGELEKIAINASEDRLLTLLELFVAMPLPASQPTPVLKSAESKGSNLSLFRYLDPAEKKKPVEISTLQLEQAVQLTLLDANFVMNDFLLNVCRKSDNSTNYDRMLQFKLETLEVQATQKTYTMETLMRLGSLSLVHHRPECKPIHVIETQLPSQSTISLPEERYLFTVSYTNVDKRCPDFRSHYRSVEQLIVLDFTTLKVLLHLEGLQQLMVVANDYQNRISVVQGQRDRMASAGTPLPTIMEDQELTTVKSKTSTVTKSTRRRKVETILLKVKIKLDEVDICFETEERPLAEISWHGLHAGLIMKDSYKQIEASIEDMRVLDLNPKTMHKEILKIIGGNVLTVNIVLYNLDEYPDVSDTDISITAQINCIRIIFLNWFVTSMLEFLSNFQTAQQAIIDASAVAADAAKANLQSAYENSIKVSLSLELKAPIIVAPENSHSFDALMIDLGHMTLRNKFFTLDVPESKVNPVIVDELTLALTNMKISCVSFEDTQYETKHETMLLRPTSFSLFVKRSLSTWFEPLPDLDISGRLKAIEITIRQSDFKMIMRMLQENLTEGQTNVAKPTSAKPSGTKLTPKVSSASTSVSAKVTSPRLVQVSVEVGKTKAPRTKIKFSFAMDSLIIDLKNTMSVSKKIHNVPRTSMEDVGLARFGLNVLSVKGRMLSDDSMHTSVLLVDCTLDDTRPLRGSRITRYLNRKPEPGFSLVDVSESSDKVRSMIDITYTQKPSDTFIDVRVYSFDLILAMDFLMRILDFTTSSITPDVPSGDVQLTPKPSVKGRPSEVSLKKKTTTAVVINTSMTTINIKVEKPDIKLVESLERKDCQVMIMNMEIAFKMRMTQDRMVMDGSVSSLQLYTRACAESEGEGLHEDEQRHYVLEPCHLSLAAAQPEGVGMHVDIAVSDIKIVVSPATINLLNRVVATMTNSEEDTGEKEDEIVTYDDLWGKKYFDSNKYWFLTADAADDAMLLEEVPSVIVMNKPVTGEICLLSSPKIVLALEMSVGSESIPVLVMESSLQAQVKDWSSKLYLESSWSMQMSYYNIAKAVWEPLIEPVETLKDNQYTHTPWELKMEVQISSNEDPGLLSTSSLPDPNVSSVDALGSTQTLSRTASKTVSISSSEPLEITATSTALDVLQQLGSSFSEAASNASDSSILDKSSKTSQTTKYSGAPYVLHNNTGLTVCLRLKEGGDFSVYTSLRGGTQNSTDYREVVLEPGASVPLQLKHGVLNLLSINANLPALQLNIQIKELQCELVIPVQRADKRYFPLSAERGSTSDVAGQESRGIISEVTMHEGAINIYLRSVVQVHNTLLVSVNVYYMTASGNEVVSLGEVAPGDTMRLPLHAVHTPTAELFFSVEGFTVSVSPFVWRDLQREVKIAKLLHCESKDRSSSENAYIRVVGSMQQVYLRDTARHTLASACFDLELRPAVLLQNCLPVDVLVSQVGHNRTQTYKPGEMFHLGFLSPTKADLIILLPNYLEKCWSCTSRLPEMDTEFSVWSFDSHDSPAKMTLDLGIHCINEDGTQKLSLYCPFWMLNKTGFSLAYRKSRKSESEKASNKADDTGNVLYHPVDYKGPILFSFRAKNFFGKKKASIRIEYGEWCDKFSLDVAGSSGVVLCKNEGRVYQVAVHNHLTFNSLTKMVIFTPFFLIVNSAPFDIECQEHGRPGDAWLKVEKNSSTAHWPLSERDEKLLIVRVAGTTQTAAPFVYTEQHTTLLKLNNEYGGIQVETQLSEGGSYITLRQYRDGLAPALIVNYSSHEITTYEKENVNSRKVPPMHNMLFTWDNPAGPRILIFEGHKKKEIENDLRKDGVGRFLINSETNVYWVSFLDGLQRVILFTDDVLLAENAHTAGESGALDMEVTVAIHGVGLSLVNNHERQEILYISISNSGIIWERRKAGSRRFKQVEASKAALLEEAYQRYVQECQVAKSVVPGRVLLDNNSEVDFEKMVIVRPHPKTLRRMLEPGLWLSLGMSAHRRQLHARLHRLQIDQQLPLPTFPVILAPVPPPRSVASEQNMKPFVEVSVVERIMEHTSVKQYKYFKILVQEFHVKVDMGLVTALINMFPPKRYTQEEALEAFALDIQSAERALEDYAAEGMANDQKHFYDNLHLSPLKAHVSFSMGSSTQVPTFVGTLLQGIGVTLTDMNDVIFKLGYYERNYEFLSQKELISQASAHYTGQALQQLYVLVLGLDVLGNPYGLVIGLKKGVEDLFYEPFQGAIQGPGEFAEGLYLGVRSLFGHTVGGAAGAMSRIAGAMGHGLAALSMDDDYQKRRRDQLNKPPANLQEGLARSGKGLVMGVFDGVTGVFTKPISGAREQGVEGFFKGLGKGAVGLVARPTAGVVDFASGSLDAVKRAAEISEDVLRHRPPRCFPSDGVVQPYSRQHAEGFKLLNDFEKGKYVSTDTYVTHVWVISKKELILCTDKRIIAMERSHVFGSWQLQWTYLWQEIPDFPVLVERGLYIPTAKKKMMGMFTNNSSGKMLIIYDEAQRSHLHATCHTLMRQSR